MKVILDKLDSLGLEEYSKLPFLQPIAKKIGVPPKYLLLGIVVALSTILVLPFFGHCLANSILFCYPAYKSFKAIESQKKEDDQRLIAYWIVFGLIYSFDALFRFLLSFLPFYHLIRFALMASLFVGDFRGSQYVYVILIRPVLLKYTRHLDQIVIQIENKAQQVSKGLKND